LAAGLPALYQEPLGLSAIEAYKVMFLGFAAFQVIGALLYSFLSSEVEGPSAQQHWTNPLKLPSRRIIFTLTGLFSIDTLTTSMVHQTIVTAWFNTKFGLDSGDMGQVFFLSHALTAASMWIAAKLANKIGLLNTMVFTHIPSSLFFIGAIFAPTAWIAITFWQLRAFMSQMDVPTKDSYTMAVVGPEERVAMASMHMVSRSATGAFGPYITTQVWTVFAASVPFVASAVVKIAYDLSLYALFRNVKPPEEVEKGQPQTEAEETMP
jgi:MFS family permease